HRRLRRRQRQGRRARGRRRGWERARRRRRGAGVGKTVDAAAGQVREVLLADLVLPERADVHGGIQQQRRDPRAVRVLAQRPDLAGAVIAIDVRSAQGIQRGAAVHVAAGDRAGSPAVVVLGDWGHEPGGATGVGNEAVQALHDAPAVILAAATRGRLAIDLLVLVLADVADVQVAGRAVEAPAPGV